MAAGEGVARPAAGRARAGDQFVETIPVPPHSPGQIGSVRVGFYSLVTGERLEATVFSGTEVPENALDLPAECIP